MAAQDRFSGRVSLSLGMQNMALCEDLPIFPALILSSVLTHMTCTNTLIVAVGQKTCWQNHERYKAGLYSQSRLAYHFQLLVGWRHLAGKAVVLLMFKRCAERLPLK